MKALCALALILTLNQTYARPIAKSSRPVAVKALKSALTPDFGVKARAQSVAVNK